MSDSEETTLPETPNAKRLSVPDFKLPPQATREQLTAEVCDALVSIAANLTFLRLEAEARGAEESVNAKAIRMLTARVAKLEKATEAKP